MFQAGRPPYPKPITHDAAPSRPAADFRAAYDAQQAAGKK